MSRAALALIAFGFSVAHAKLVIDIGYGNDIESTKRDCAVLSNEGDASFERLYDLFKNGRGPASTPPAPQPQKPPAGKEVCGNRKLSFAANYFPSVPARESGVVWGGNASGTDAIYSKAFLDKVALAKDRGLETFAYFEGPCGNTGGVDDGEVARCSGIHNRFNSRFANGTSSSQRDRWKPYTMQQLKDSGKHGVDHCEIDNLDNNVKIPLVPLLREIKALYDKKQIHCRLVLKNLGKSDLGSVKKAFPTPADANFISPFHIFETKSQSQASSLTKAMEDLKGPGAVTILDLNTNKYGENQTRPTFRSCTNDSRFRSIKRGG